MNSNISAVLTNHGLKATIQRTEVLRLLLSDKNHPSAEIIHQKIAEKYKGVSLATVYRILDDFHKVGLIKRVAEESGTKRYDAHLDPHHHIECVETREIIDFEDSELNELLANYLKLKKIENFEIQDIKLHISGKKQDHTSPIQFHHY